MGLTTENLNSVLSGVKSIECRLNRGKFINLEPNDLMYVHEDVHSSDRTTERIYCRALVRVLQLEAFPTFERLFFIAGIDRIAPAAKGLREALDACHIIYPPAEEAKYGVLAIHLELIQENPAPPVGWTF